MKSNRLSADGRPANTQARPVVTAWWPPNRRETFTRLSHDTNMFLDEGRRRGGNAVARRGDDGTAMRYGIVREADSLPPPASQKLILKAHGCDALIEEEGAGALTGRRLEELISGLRPGDELLLPSLDIFLMTTAEVALALQDLLDAKLIVKVANGALAATLVRQGDASAGLVAMLADHERRRPTTIVQDSRPRSAGGSRKPLSRYQIEYARKLYAKGEPLRAIGLLFQVAPTEVAELLGVDRSIGLDIRHGARRRPSS
jgi:DNA invertase Pin-like site-specific DNA recombinase